uniref:Ion transport domain-containing protein n=1 Tax=Timema tahoe TaxID=61484 RepID=A0A7R9IEL1_9NEOP|nr:unnamed protein product [Timema tahoe]
MDGVNNSLGTLAALVLDEGLQKMVPTKAVLDETCGDVVLYAHSASGCDTNSGSYNQGKVKAISILQKDPELRSTVTYDKQSSLYKNTLGYMNIGFTSMFTVECILKIIAFGVRYDDAPPLLVDILQIMNTFFILFFLIECLLKLIAFGYKSWSVWVKEGGRGQGRRLDTGENFFKDPWNTFDFITVIGSIIDALVIELGVSHWEKPYAMLDLVTAHSHV